MEHYTIGTAGHIDHGKTSLTKHLTGVDTDRLTEEKERKISIELGFAPLTLSSGRHVSIIDVPGHERFIRQMVAGVSGIDLVLLVVAADEGVMPQTVEHLHILHLLGVHRGIIVLTKTDLVDCDFLELVYDDVREAVKDTFLQKAPIVETSVVTGEGIEVLKQEIEQQLQQVPARPVDGPFQLPIDRVFTLKGVGTVVTGTMYTGSVQLGDEIEVLPERLRAKVRHLQVHGKDVSIARAGQRTALNITQVKKDDLYRGQVLATPNYWSPTDRIDVYIQTVPNAPSIKHQSTVNVHIGSDEQQGELILYDRPSLQPGEKVYATIRFKTPIIASRGHRFIIRRPTPSTTIGGGEIVRPYAQKLKFHASSATFIKQIHTADLSERISHFLQSGTLVYPIKVIAKQLTESEQTIRTEITRLIEQRDVIEIFPEHVALTAKLDTMKADSLTWIGAYHERYPLRYGPSRAEWAARFFPGLHTRAIDALLYLWREYIRTDGDDVALRDFTPFIPTSLQPSVEKLLDALRSQGLQVENWNSVTDSAAIEEKYRGDLLNFLIRRGDVVQISDNLALHRDVFEEAKQQIIAFFKQNDTLSAQQARTLFNVSRKYLIPLLETMDKQGVTRRDGNVRRIISNR